MKHSSSWFSLTEIIVGVILLMIAGISIYSTYEFLHKKDEIVEKSLFSIYFHKYIFNIANTIVFPEAQTGTLFYLSQEGINSISLNNNPSGNTGDVWFLSSLEKAPTKHSIEVFSIDEIAWVSYVTYKIITEYYDYEKTSYLTK